MNETKTKRSPQGEKSKLSKADRAYAIAMIFFKENNVIHFDDTFYLYNEGIWRQESTDNTRAWIAEQYLRKFYTPCVKAQLAEITQMIQNLTYGKYRKEIKYMQNILNSKYKINVNSGILNLKTLEVTPYSKSSFCFHKLPFDYDENAECPVMEKFLTTSMNYKWDEEKGMLDCKNLTSEEIAEYIELIQFIQEWMGYSLIPGNPYHKILIMKGEGRNGKSVLQYLWEYIAGQNNCSHVDIKHINDGTQIFMTKNKLINFCQDMSHGQQLDTSTMKHAIAEGTLNVNEKWKSQYKMHFTAKIIMACNELPYVKNNGASSRDRIHILPFDKVFTKEERDPYLKDKLIKEAGQIFSWAVKGLRRLEKRGYFVPPKRCLMTAQQYLRSNDSIEMWIFEDEVLQKGARTDRQEAYRQYKSYCNESGLKALGKNKFYDKMEARGVETVKSNGKRLFEGVKMVNSM